MTTARLPNPLRVRHVGTDPIHAAHRFNSADYITACQIWLSGADGHIRLSDNAEITCSTCQRATDTSEK